MIRLVPPDRKITNEEKIQIIKGFLGKEKSEVMNCVFLMIYHCQPITIKDLMNKMDNYYQNVKIFSVPGIKYHLRNLIKRGLINEKSLLDAKDSPSNPFSKKIMEKYKRLFENFSVYDGFKHVHFYQISAFGEEFIEFSAMKAQWKVIKDD